jgi:hypothetical protein
MHVPKLIATAAATGLAAFGLAAAAPAMAQSHASGGHGVVNPYSPAYHHGYRHGFVPTIPRLKLMQRWDRSHGISTSADDLNYGGGIDGIGVTSGHEKVYLVFYGSQWGTASTNGNGDVVFSGDPSGEAPYLQELMKGLGTGSELWSGVMTQYCDGVATGAQSCPSSNTEHVAYPTGGALAGVWADEGSASPYEASAAQLGQVAVNAASHFGNTTAASNRDAQYVVISPTGTDPDGWLENGFCAWHDYNGDVGVTSPYGDIAFTNFPYVTDLGTSCGQDFVNPGSAGTLDGVSIVEGHEYAETITDQNPPGGWTDSSGEETGDKCAWDEGPGAPAQDVALGTGSFAMQSTWANDGAGGAGTCEISHPIVPNGSDTVTVANPGSQSAYQHSSVSLQVSASSTGGYAITGWAASGLPAGLSINSSGLISGSVTASPGTYPVTVTATDSNGGLGSASFNWTVNADVGTPVKNSASAKCLNDLNGSVSAGNPIIIWTCVTNGPNEKFSHPSNAGELVVYGQCLTDPGSGGGGTIQEIEPCTGAPDQTWFHNATKEYVLGANGLCLTDPGGSTANGTGVVVKPCKNASYQHWTGS